MRRIPREPLAAFAVAAAVAAVAATSAAPPAAPAATPSPSPSSKDPCGATKSKWAHMQCQEFTSSAPGDEYFGRMKISYLGIDNTFKDGTISAGAYTTDSRLVSKLMFADEALQRWASKYPGDPQLPRAYFLGVQVFRKVYTQEAQQIAWRYMQTLVKTYPSTYFGKTIKASLSKGFTEHWFANALPCPTPLPKGVQPERTPSASPTPSPAPGEPSVEIIVPPCVPATPSPSPEPTGPASPLPRPGASAPMASPSPSGSAPAVSPQPSGSPLLASPSPTGSPRLASPSPTGSPRLASPSASALPPMPSGAVAPVPSPSPSTKPSPPATTARSAGVPVRWGIPAALPLGGA